MTQPKLTFRRRDTITSRVITATVTEWGRSFSVAVTDSLSKSIIPSRRMFDRLDKAVKYAKEQCGIEEDE